MKNDGTPPDLKDSQSKEIEVKITFSYESYKKPPYKINVKLNVSQEGIAILKFGTGSDVTSINLEVVKY